jgi:protoporphyrinogen oxidase
MSRCSAILLGAFVGLVLILSTTAMVKSAGAKEETKETASSAVESAKQQKDEFVSKAHKEMDDLSARIQELKKKAEAESGEAKIKLERQVEELRKEQRIVVKKVARLKSASGEAWRDFKADVENSIEHLKESFQKLSE